MDEVRERALSAALQLKPGNYGMVGGNPQWHLATGGVNAVLADAKLIEAYLRGPEPAAKATKKRK